MDFDQRQTRGAPRARPQHVFERPGSDIKKSGYLKKLKTNKKKFFVLRSTSSSGPARLEYHDSEKKFNAGHLPKRSIELHTCFNINRQVESRHCKNGVVLYTTKDSFVVLAESSEEQEAWLSVMLEYQYEYLPNGDEHRDHYEYVWSVTLLPKGLGYKSGEGQCRVGLNSTSVSLIKISSFKPHCVIQLPTIRNIAQSKNSFCMEVGKFAPTGEGKFFFQADDPDIVKDMHSILHHYMNNMEDPNQKKDTSFRARSESHSSMSPNHRRPIKMDQRPASFYTSGTTSWRSSMDTTSPGSVSSFGPSDHILGSHRPRSDTGDSHISRGSSQHEDGPHDFFVNSYKNGDMHESMRSKELNVVPADMTTPPSPKMFEEQLSAYLEMDVSLHSNHSSGSNSMGLHHNASVSSTGSCYMAMSPHSQPSSVKGDLSPSHLDVSPSSATSYMAMASGSGAPGTHFGGHMSAPIPIHPHVTSHPQHPTPLPTVREGGSNEGYLPMDVTSSPSTPSNLRPEPVKCMLSLDNDPLSSTGLPPRTYSLGSKPVGKKNMGYMDMGMGGRASGGGSRKGSLSNDMLRATSAPHIIHKGRRDRERDRDPLHGGGGGTDSPIPSPLSMSIKSDDSDSFMEYMPMRPRTASDSFNYRPRTSSQGKLQPMCRPRSSSHGQGTRPVTKFSSRLSQDAVMNRSGSRDSSLHDSFDSLRVSNESLRRIPSDHSRSPVVNVTEQGEMIMRGSPPPHHSGRNGNNSTSSNSTKELVDSYMSMDLATNLHHHHKSSSSSSPHRMRTDSNSSGSHRSDFPTSSQDSEYTEMAPIGHSSRSGSYSSGSKVVIQGVDEAGDDYMNMGGRRPTPSPVLSTSLQSPSMLSDANYVNMDLDFAGGGGGGPRRSESLRSASVENVESYITYDPAPLSSGSKLRTGSVGSKDKKVSIRYPATVSSKKNSGLSSHYQQPPTVSASTKKGGSSDSIRKPTRQSSMEKYGSLGKDFRKKSGSTGSRPMNVSKMAGSSSSGVGSSNSNHMGFNMVPIRKSTTPVSLSAHTRSAGWEGGAGGGGGEVVDLDDEYIEFSPNAYRDASNIYCDNASNIASNAPSSSASDPNSALALGTHIVQSPLLPSSSSFSLSSSLSAATTIVTTIGGTAGIPLSHPNSKHQQQQQQKQSLNDGDDDYTPFAPANPAGSGPHPSTGHLPHQQQSTKRTQNDSDYTPFSPAGGGGRGQDESDYLPFAPTGGRERGQQNDSDYTPFAPAGGRGRGQQNDSDYTPFAPAGGRGRGNQSSSDYTPFAPAGGRDRGHQSSSDYTPFAPAGGRDRGHQSNSDYTPFAPAGGRGRGQQNDSDYTPFAPAGSRGGGQQNDSDYTPFAPAGGRGRGQQNDSDYTPFAPAGGRGRGQQNDSDYTPFAPAGGRGRGQQNDSDYTPFAPAGSSSASISPQNPPFPKSSSFSSSRHPPSSATNNQPQPSSESSDYVSYDPSPRPIPIGSSSTAGQGQHSITPQSFNPPARHKTPKVQHHSSLDSASRPDSGVSGVGVHASTSLTFHPVQHTSPLATSSSSSLPSNQPLSSSLSPSTIPSTSSLKPSQLTFSYAAPQAKKSDVQNNEENEYLNFNPTANPGGCSSEDGPSVGGGGKNSLVKATSLISKNNQAAKRTSDPLTVDIESPSSSLASPSPLTMSKHQGNNENNSSKTGTALKNQQHDHHQQPPLSCITTTHLSNSNTVPTPSLISKDSNSKNMKISQTSSPNNGHSPSPSPQPPSPLPTVSENNPPWNSTTSSTRQKHSSGSSTSSQKTRRVSGDSSTENLNNSNKPLRKSSKSDSNSSLSSSSGSKNSNNSGRRRAPSGDKTPLSGSAEKSPLLSPSSRSNEEFFSGPPSLCSGKSLEAKMVPVESKIRHSVRDMTSCHSSGSDIGGGGEGNMLFRPDSTPCFQQMDTESSSGDNTRLAGGVGSGSGSGSIVTSAAGSDTSSPSSHHGVLRSRHSLSDLGAYQQMNVGGGSYPNESTGGSGGGSGDKCGSGGNLSHFASSSPSSNLQIGISTTGGGGKPLNYAQLDLSASGGGSSSSGGGYSSSGNGGGSSSEAKLRNLSDGDEKEPPLSYAKIDFVKSQNMNKGMGYGSAGNGADGSASKT